MKELCGRAEAEQDLDAALAARRRRFVAVFVLERLTLIEEHFGPEEGAGMLNAFAGRLASCANSTSRMYRWSGPSFVITLDRDGTLASVFEEIEPWMADGALPAGAAGRLRASWTVFPLWELRSIGSLIQKVDFFIATHPESWQG